MMADSASTLEVIEESSFEGQNGQAIEKLQSSIGAFPLELQLAAGAYEQVGQVLVSYGDVLEQEKPRINREAEDCDELWRAYAVLPGDRYGNTDPDVAGVGPGGAHLPVTAESTQAAEDNQAEKDAYDAWEEAARDFDRYYDNWEQGYDDAVDGITDEMSGSIVGSFWSSILGLVIGPMGVSDQVRPYLMGKDLPASAEGMADLWSRLSVVDKAALAERYPNLGNRGGIPAAERDLLNRAFLDERVAGIDQRIADLEERLAGLSNGPGDRAERASIDARVEELQAELDGYAGVERGLAGDNRYLLHLDGEGRAAIAVNNPDTADNVATYVPGVNSELSTMDAGVGNAERLVYEASQLDESSTTAAIAWYGYHAPSDVEVAVDGTVSVASGDVIDPVVRPMQDAAPKLDAFQDGLGASRESSPANVTVVGHSYGSSVVGLAAASGLRADQVVLLGSPGVPLADVTDARLIDGKGDQVPVGQVAESVYAGKTENDPIPRAADLSPLDGIGTGVPGYYGEQLHNLLHPDEGGPLGNDPTDDGFGAQSITSDPGRLSDPLGAHTQYLDQGATSLEEVGPVIAGKKG